MPDTLLPNTLSYTYDAATKTLYVNLDPNFLYQGVYNVSFVPTELTSISQPELFLAPEDLNASGQWVIPNVTSGTYLIKQAKGDSTGS